MEAEPHLFSDTVEPVRRSEPGEVSFIRMDAVPEPGSEDFGTVGGAFVNCYVDADDLRSAELRAIKLIQEHEWRPQRFDTWALTCAECAQNEYAEDGMPTPRELVEQALVDGVCCAFHTWPIDAPDAEDWTG